MEVLFKYQVAIKYIGARLLLSQNIGFSQSQQNDDATDVTCVKWVEGMAHVEHMPFSLNLHPPCLDCSDAKNKEDVDQKTAEQSTASLPHSFLRRQSRNYKPL